jgi:hypothetical protein
MKKKVILFDKKSIILKNSLDCIFFKKLKYLYKKNMYFNFFFYNNFINFYKSANLNTYLSFFFYNNLNYFYVCNVFFFKKQFLYNLNFLKSFFKNESLKFLFLKKKFSKNYYISNCLFLNTLNYDLNIMNEYVEYFNLIKINFNKKEDQHNLYFVNFGFFVFVSLELYKFLVVLYLNKLN